MAYIEVTFTGLAEGVGDILIALLSEQGFEGFEEDAGALKAFTLKHRFNEDALSNAAEHFTARYSLREMADTNWNDVWESSFHPVVIDDFCTIRADFHSAFPITGHEIIITPKMSFGTGHHATTFMMISQMKNIDFAGKRVLDFGTGTGVLAILANKLGAARIVAVDNDEWSIANAEENLKRNHAGEIKLEAPGGEGQQAIFDIILANITRNVILDNFSFFTAHLAANGTLLLSGLLHDDEDRIMDKARKSHLRLEKKLVRDNWISLRLGK